MAEGGGLLNRYTAITRIVGSNPIPSAISIVKSISYRSLPGLSHISSHFRTGHRNKSLPSSVKEAPSDLRHRS